MTITCGPLSARFPTSCGSGPWPKCCRERAKCYLLLGQSEAAWHELALVRDMCRMLEAKPASDCSTLVETMIDVAITGLYTSIIQDGLRLQAWREPELAAMQKQLMDIRLPPLLRTSFNAERAAVCRTFETSSPTELGKCSISNGREPQGDMAATPGSAITCYWTHAPGLALSEHVRECPA